MFSVVPNATSGTFTIMLTATQGGSTTGLGAVTLPSGPAPRTSGWRCSSCCSRSAATRRCPAPRCRCAAARDNLSLCSDSVYVWQVGGAGTGVPLGYLIGFRGEVNEDPAHPVTVGLSALGSDATAYDALRTDGLNYYGLETLNLLLGSGDDVLNVRGTLPVTNVSTAVGNDRVYVSSEANVGIDETPQFLAGHLDDIDGTLNLDFGAGRNNLLVSDEGTDVGDPNVLMTDRLGEATGRDADVAANAEIFLVGLATGSITWRTAGDGNLADGVRIWAGSGNDTFTIDGTHRRAGLRTTTWLNTGLGDDSLSVALTNGQDGFFVLNTQGPNDNLLDLTLDLQDGEEPFSPDSLSVTVNGVLLDPSRYVVNNGLDTVGLFDSFSPGDHVTVTAKQVRSTLLDRGADSFDLGTALGAGESVRVLVNGVWIIPTVTGTLATWDAGTQQALADLPAGNGDSFVVVEITRVLTEQFTLAQVAASDDDTVHAESSTLPLVIFGGQGTDQLHGGTGGDIILGDRGRVLWFTPGSVPVADLGDQLLDPEQLAALEAAAVSVSGNGGFGDKTSGVAGELVGLVITTDPTIGTRDLISTGGGMDTVARWRRRRRRSTPAATPPPTWPTSSSPTTGSSTTSCWTATPSTSTGSGAPTRRSAATTPSTTGAGDDVVFGGTGADTIRAGNGRNIVLGDNGQFTAVADETSHWGNLPMASGTLTTTDPTIGGADDITTGTGIDVVVGGADGDTAHLGAGADTFVGDHGTITWAVKAGALQVVTIDVIDNGVGGNDKAYGEAGEDVLIGGTRNDRLDGGSGRDLVFGDNVRLDRTSTYGDYTNPRFRKVTGSQIYSTGDATTANVATGWNNDPLGHPAWGDFRITFEDHDLDTQTAGLPVDSTDVRFGNDYLAGGAGDDTIFGQLGDDTIQGDGHIDNGAYGYRDPAGVLTLHVGADTNLATDGEDYVEGGGGNDTIFGDGGRDDLIGGSSDQFSLTDAAHRPDGNDLVYGGSGARRAAATTVVAGHGTDSDTIVGDNGQIFRLVRTDLTKATGTAYLGFTYDSYTDAVRLLPRAVVLLDYTPGGPDRVPGHFPTGVDSSNPGNTVVGDWTEIWGTDEVHGEGGDDTVYLGGGNDVAFGDAGDDDIIGGWGHDWISGGTGQDGVLGDDGRIFTFRNGSAELLNGVTNPTGPSQITTPGNIQVADIYVTGRLNKYVDLTPFALNPASDGYDEPLATPRYANDVIFGGLGDDFLHGGAGEDAISGAEALPVSYAPTYSGGLVETDFTRPFNNGNLLGFDTAAGQFLLYDEYDPRRKITLNPDGSLNKANGGVEWFLNNDATEGPQIVAGTATTPRVGNDGADVLFGDHGNDWLVGGTGRDALWGGWGNDLLQADDILTTNANLNDVPETNYEYEDRAVGGAGLDVLIGNTGGDRLIDWVGEFNSFIVPFSPFGIATVSRQVPPRLMEFLYAL